MTMTDENDIDAELADLAQAVNEPGDVAEPSPSVALEPVIQQSYLPQPAEWQLICQQAEVLANSDLVPKAYYRKPANVVLATLAGRPHGWDAVMSMRSFHIIEGQPTMKPELMLALVRARGHSVKGKATPEGSEITGTRCDNGDQLTVAFTIQSAVQAGLCQIKDGKTWARSDKGKPLPWEQYPEDMCWARTVSKLCRRLFPDVVLGAGYVPEEFGVSVNDMGDVIELDSMEMSAFAQQSAPKEPETLTDNQAVVLRDRASALPDEAKEVFRGMLREREIPIRFTGMTVARSKIVEGLVASLEKRAEGGEWGDWSKPSTAVDAPDNPMEPGPDDVTDVCGDCGEEESACTCGTTVNGVQAMDLTTLQMLLALPFDGLVAVGVADLRAACVAAHVEWDSECDAEDLATLLIEATKPFEGGYDGD